jgi:hypothetical protein
MSEIVNLNKARKAKAKVEAKRVAAENRVKFGRPKAETELERRRREKAEKALDQAKRED